jgi:hypothetical protein
MRKSFYCGDKEIPMADERTLKESTVSMEEAVAE